MPIRRPHPFPAWTTALVFVIAGMFVTGHADNKIERIIFDEVQIEGKIRRPQLVLIKAEQRQSFTPMVMQSLDSEINIGVFSNGDSVQKSPYRDAFRFDGETIVNYAP